MKICEKCGSPVTDNSKLCKSCRDKINNSGTVSKSLASKSLLYGENKKGISYKKALTSVIVLITAVLMILSFFAFTKINNGNNVSVPEDIGNTSDVYFSNVMNKSSVLTKDDITYFVGGGGDSSYFIGKSQGSGSYEKLYTSESSIQCLNEYKEVLYFISAVNGFDLVCYLDSEGNAVPITKDSNADGLFIYGKNAYYTVNRYGKTQKSGALYRINLESGKSENITVLGNADISGVLEYNGKIYILYSDRTKSNAGCILTADAENPEIRSDFYPPENKSADIGFITVSEGIMYFTVSESSGNGYSYSLYSIEPDGKNFKKISSYCGKNITVFGNYIYYNAAPNANSPALNVKKNLYRIKSDGTESVILSEISLLRMGISENKIYYADPDDKSGKRMSLDGSAKENLN